MEEAARLELQQERDELRQALGRIGVWSFALESMTAEGPVLSLIEDLHGADARVTRLLREVYAPRTDPAYWDGLQAAIMSRVPRSGSRPTC